jgi:hypothetical protein
VTSPVPVAAHVVYVHKKLAGNRVYPWTSVDLSLSRDRSFVLKISVAKEARSASTNVGGTVNKYIRVDGQHAWSGCLGAGLNGTEDAGKAGLGRTEVR